MTTKPTYTKLPVSNFDLSLLPSQARNLGSKEFNEAVLFYFSAKYANEGKHVLVAVNDKEISVLEIKPGASPLALIMPILQAGHIADAVPLLEALNKRDPDNAEVLFNLGRAHCDLGHFDDALAHLKHAVRLNPGHAHAWIAIGVAYKQMGKYDLALEPMRKAVEADPKDGYALRNLGAELVSCGELQEGLKNLREARKVLPHDPLTLYGLAATLQVVGGKKNLEEAAGLYSVVMTKAPGSDVAKHARQALAKLA